MGKGIRLVLLIIVFAVLAFVLWRSRAPAPPAEQTAEQRASRQKQKQKQPEKFQSLVLAVPADQMRKALKDGYRPQPDGRFLKALGLLDSFAGSAEAGPVETRFEETQWVVFAEGKQAGMLPEYPDFDNGLQLLMRYATAHPWKVGSGSAPQEKARKELDQFFLPHPLLALEAIDRDWNGGNRTAENLQLAVRALTLTTLQLSDRVGVADDIPARALAFLALARASTGDAMPRETCLLAWLLGYTANAGRLAQALPPSDPARLFVLQNWDALLDQAKGKDKEAQYLYMLHLAEYDAPGALLKSIAQFQSQDAPSWAFARPLLDNDDFDINRDMPMEFIDSMMKSLGGNPGDQNRLAPFVKAFQARLAVVSKSEKGPFLDGATLVGVYDACLLSSLWSLGHFYMDELSSVEDAASYAKQLKGDYKGALADYLICYDHLLQCKQGKSVVITLLQDVDRLKNLGVPAFHRIFREVLPSGKNREPLFLASCRAFARRTDTRPAHIAELQDLAWYYLYDVRWAEELAVQVARLAPSRYPAVEIWHAGVSADIPRLQQLLDSSNIGTSERSEILEYLEAAGATRAAIKAGYERLFKDEPDNWEPRRKCVLYLRDKQHDFKRAEEVTREFVNRVGPEGGFDYIHAHASLARTCRLQGHYDQAWKAVEPVVDTGQENALTEASLILSAQGKHREAEEMGRQIIDRYQDSALARVNLAEIYWQQGKYTEAAGVLNDRIHPINRSDWYWTVADEFVRALSDHPDQARLAFAALKQSGIQDYYLNWLGQKMGKEGHAELAFDLMSQVPPNRTGNFMTDYELNTIAYSYLKQMKGEQAALEWLKPRIKRDKINRFSIAAMDTGQFELLWTIIDQPDPRDSPQYVWLLRAVASTEMKDDPHRKELLNHYSSLPASYEKALGLYLLADGPEKDLWGYVNKARRCEFSYYMGMKAVSDGDLAAACEWFRVALETGQPDAESGMAYSMLQGWIKEKKSLARLAAELRKSLRQ